jgi:hypothetical protein
MVRTEEDSAYHTPRGTLAYAHVLLRAGDARRAERAIRSVLALQETRPQDAHYGNFRWRLEELCVRDLNGVEFMLDELIELAREHSATLSGGIVEEMRTAIALGLAEIDRLDVHPSYTNIALSDIANSVLGGELLDEARHVARGARKLDEWIAFTNASGAPHEFNSPTYAAVDILRLAAVVRHTRDRRVAVEARIAEERLWLHVAAHYHPGLAQLAGPHSRSYYDGWTGAGGYLKLVLWKLLGDEALRRETPYAPRTREEMHIGVALAELHCPDYVERWLREKRYPFDAREITDAALGIDITTYMTESYALGTMSRDFSVGEPREAWPGLNSLLLHVRRDAPPGYNSLYVRYVVNDKAPGGSDGHGAEDHWDEGRPVIAQHRHDAIVAYTPLPRARPAHSYKLSVRMLGLSAEDEVWIGDRRVDAWPIPVARGDRILIAAGDAYVALIPLDQTDMGSDAPIELALSDGVLALDIYNYKGPAKTFWEYRSQSGAFYRGNVRNGFAIEVAERAEFADTATFREHIARSRIDDAVGDHHERNITYESGGNAVALTYSDWDMSLIERRIGGSAYRAPMARVGAVDGNGPQFLQTTADAFELGGLNVVAQPGPKWLFADADAHRYVFVHPADAVTGLRLTTPATTIECEAFGFGRVDLDEAAGVLNIETTEPPGAIAVRPAGALQIVLNGDALAIE